MPIQGNSNCGKKLNGTILLAGGKQKISRGNKIFKKIFFYFFTVNKMLDYSFSLKYFEKISILAPPVNSMLHLPLVNYQENPKMCVPFFNTIKIKVFDKCTEFFARECANILWRWRRTKCRGFGERLGKKIK
jgi:hypothetical protein